MNSSTSQTALVRGRAKTDRPAAYAFGLGSSELSGTGEASVDRAWQLTHREQQIVNLLLQGYDNSEIARQLKITRRTVKAHFNRLFLRFGIVDGIKRVKLATLLYRKRLSSDTVSTAKEAQLGGNEASLPSMVRTSTTVASPGKLEPYGISLKTVFEPALWYEARDNQDNACAITAAVRADGSHSAIGTSNLNLWKLVRFVLTGMQPI